jgi:hypothetical protein
MRLHQQLPDLPPEPLHLGRDRRVPPQEPPGEPDGAERQAQGSAEAPVANLRELQAATPEIRHDPVADRETQHGGLGAEPGLLPAGQDADRDAFPLAQGAQQQVAIRGVPDRGGRDRHHARRLAIPHPAQEPMDAIERRVDGIRAQPSGRTVTEPRLHPFLLEHLEPAPLDHPRQQKARGVRTEVHQRDQLRGVCPSSGPSHARSRGCPPSSTTCNDRF